MTRRVVVLALLAAMAGCVRANDDPNHLSIWGDFEPAEQELLLRHIDWYREANPGVTIEPVFLQTESLRNQFQTAALAKAGPELVYGASDQVGPFSIMGLIEPLESTLHPDTLALYVDSAKPSLEGHIYALADQVGNHLTLGFNRALVAEAPRDTEEWIRLAREQTVDVDGDGRPDRYGIVLNLSEPFWLVPWLGAYGGWVMDQNGDPTLDSPAMTRALEFFLRLQAEGVIPEGCDYQLAETLFKEGDAAFIVNGPWAWKSYRDAGIDVGLGVIPPVEGPDTYPTPMTACKAFSVRADLPEAKRQRAYHFLRFLTSARVVGDVATSLGVLPSRTDVGEWPAVVANETVQASWAQLRKGQLMPIVPEMRAIWDVMRPAFQQVQGGSMTATAAPAWMQEQAVRKIEEMRL